jgi:hypothetical protein
MNGIRWQKEVVHEECSSDTIDLLEDCVTNGSHTCMPSVIAACYEMRIQNGVKSHQTQGALG